MSKPCFVSYELVDGIIGPIRRNTAHIQVDPSCNIPEQLKNEIRKTVATDRFWIAEWSLETDEDDSIDLLLAPDWF